MGRDYLNEGIDMEQESAEQAASEAWLILEAEHLIDRLDWMKRYELDTGRRRRIERIRNRADLRAIRRYGEQPDPQSDVEPNEQPF